jgi:hypothetical protein
MSVGDRRTLHLSSTEAEIYAMTDAAKEATILKAMIKDSHFQLATRQLAQLASQMRVESWHFGNSQLARVGNRS